MRPASGTGLARSTARSVAVVGVIGTTMTLATSAFAVDLPTPVSPPDAAVFVVGKAPKRSATGPGAESVPFYRYSDSATVDAYGLLTPNVMGEQPSYLEDDSSLPDAPGTYFWQPTTSACTSADAFGICGTYHDYGGPVRKLVLIPPAPDSRFLSPSRTKVTPRTTVVKLGSVDCVDTCTTSAVAKLEGTGLSATVVTTARGHAWPNTRSSGKPDLPKRAKAALRLRLPSVSAPREN